MTSSSTIFLIDQLCVRHPALTAVKPAITAACEQLISCYEQGGKVLVCGNGGSCADADHIVGELMKSFELLVHYCNSTIPYLQLHLLIYI